ncbi:GNAT family protein [Clostridium sp.]|uniref:GNAT family N-acetyltransferase n=1 Tax=Clostridium sp. TaxID=1506 RepID=UPI002FC8BF02
MEKVFFDRIDTDRIMLRKLEDTDADNFYRYRKNPEVALYQGWEPYTYEKALNFIEQQKNFRPNIPGTWFQIAIALKSDNTLIGDCALHTLEEDPEQAEIGFTLEPIYQNQGYAREAVKVVINYIFTVLKKHRVIARVDPRNQRSINLLEKVGMRKEGCFIKSYLSKGEYVDEVHFAILREEWEGLNKTLSEST